MKPAELQNLGNLALLRGGEWGKPRHHMPSDDRFDRDVRSVVASWKGEGGEGGYASRAIANTAQELQWPCRGIGRQMRDAIDADVPLDRVEALGHLLVQYAREYHARKRRLKPAA